jgi:hypothetical protein
MRNLRSRLKKLELRRRLKRQPRIVTRCELLDGEFEFSESRPSDGDDDDTIEILLEYEDSRRGCHGLTATESSQEIGVYGQTS